MGNSASRRTTYKGGRAHTVPLPRPRSLETDHVSCLMKTPWASPFPYACPLPTVSRPALHASPSASRLAHRGSSYSDRARVTYSLTTHAVRQSPARRGPCACPQKYCFPPRRPRNAAVRRIVTTMQRRRRWRSVGSARTMQCQWERLVKRVTLLLSCEPVLDMLRTCSVGHHPSSSSATSRPRNPHVGGLPTHTLKS